ncbi:hypothetical protein AABB24_007639 [Solanum stoloniferum]|uniref:Uncharacterized protein n=1 Tax=Solanum stoloniferum TaxID=62892 RepID=A0ABD2UPZ2_9SOLN
MYKPETHSYNTYRSKLCLRRDDLAMSKPTSLEPLQFTKMTSKKGDLKLIFPLESKLDTTGCTQSLPKERHGYVPTECSSRTPNTSTGFTSTKKKVSSSWEWKNVNRRAPLRADKTPSCPWRN